MKRIILSVVLCACLLLFTGCDEILSSLLSLDGLGFLTTATTTAGSPPPGEQPSGPSVPDNPPEEEASLGYYYDQLSERARAVYRAVYKDNKNTDGIPISLGDALSFTDVSTNTEALNEAMCTAVKQLVQPALDALNFDHPEISWIAMGQSTFSIYTSRRDNGDGTSTLLATELTFHLAFKEPVTTADDALALEEALRAAIDTYPKTAKNRYDTLLAIHHKLCEDVSYQSEAAAAHDAVGALLYGEAVCDGYAKAFKILCDAYNIPCIIVVGSALQNGKEEPHAWNYVEMENGKWYAMDATWNDSGAFPTKNYFLVGTDTLQPSLTMGSFSYSHRPSGRFSPGDYTPFVFPALERSRYSASLFSS